MSFVFTILSVVFILVAILLIIIILVQPHHSESGLAGAFGGGSSESFFGTKTVSVATKITVLLAIVFMVLSVLLNKVPVGKEGRSIMNREAENPPVTTPETLPEKPPETPPSVDDQGTAPSVEETPVTTPPAGETPATSAEEKTPDQPEKSE